MSLQTRLSDLITAIGADIKKLRGVVSIASVQTLTPVGTARQFNVTAQNQDLSVAAPSPAMADGQSIIFRIKDNGVSRQIFWNAGGYRAVGVVLPASTVVGKTVYVGGIWNSVDSIVDIIAVAQQA